MRAPWLMVVAAVVLAACSGSTPQQEFGRTDNENIRKLISDFVPAYNAKDAKKVSMFFSMEAVVLPPNAPTVRGRQAIEQYYVSRFGQGASDLVLEPRDIAGSGTLAYVDGDYRLKMAPTGGPERRDRGKFLFVFRDFNGQWLLERLMFSSDFATGPIPVD